jgi:short-subunit dehydrogenase
MNLKDKNILITGASKGLGKSLADNLAKEGASLLLVARSDELLKQHCENVITSKPMLPINKM